MDLTATVRPNTRLEMKDLKRGVQIIESLGRVVPVKGNCNAQFKRQFRFPTFAATFWEEPHTDVKDRCPRILGHTVYIGIVLEFPLCPRFLFINKTAMKSFE